MILRNKNVVLLLACVFISSLALTASADDTSNTLTGLWEQINAGGIVSLVDFDKDGTLAASSATPGFSDAQGTWTRVGSRSFSSKVIGYIHATDTAPILRYELNGLVELSADGQSQANELSGELTLLDGTLLQTISDSTVATRIPPPDDSD
jgi:hypothetical protein